MRAPRRAVTRRPVRPMTPSHPPPRQTTPRGGRAPGSCALPGTPSQHTRAKRAPFSLSPRAPRACAPRTGHWHHLKVAPRTCHTAGGRHTQRRPSRFAQRPAPHAPALQRPRRPLAERPSARKDGTRALPSVPRLLRAAGGGVCTGGARRAPTSWDVRRRTAMPRLLSWSGWLARSHARGRGGVSLPGQRRVRKEQKCCCGVTHAVSFALRRIGSMRGIWP